MDTENKSSLERKIEKDHKIMKLLKASELRYHIGTAVPTGAIDIQLRFGDTNYQFLLDSVPLEAEDNEKMLKWFNLK